MIPPRVMPCAQWNRENPRPTWDEIHARWLALRRVIHWYFWERKLTPLDLNIEAADRYVTLLGMQPGRVIPL